MNLRDAFEAGTARVTVAPDALGVIRAKVRRRARRRRLTAVALAAVVVVGLGVGLVVVRPAPTTPPVGAAVSSAPSAPPSATTAAPLVAIPVTVPVYFSGAEGLYREFVATTMPAAGQEVAVAVQRSLDGTAADPDYGSRWPTGSRVSQVSDGAVPTVDLVAPASAADDPLALQQVVYTATGVLADLGRPSTGIRLAVNGVPVAGGGVLTRASTVDTLAPVWLISPQQGATVTGPFEAYLVGTVPEAAARLRVRDATGAVVSDEPVLLSAGPPARGEARVPLTLPPGRYTLEAYFVSLRDGAERALDGHTITVA